MDLAGALAGAQSLVLGAGFAACALLESVRATGCARPWRERWRHDAANLLLWLITLVAFNLLLGTAWTPVLPALEIGRIGVLHFLGLPAWLHALVAFLAYDAADYVFHRMSHEVRWLWLLHAVHHSDDALDLSTHVRAHPLHFLLAILWKALAVAAIGVPYWVVLARELLALPVVQLHHAAVRWPAGLERLLGTLLVTPAMHRLHHSPQARLTDSNFGSLVPWWDRLLRTYSRPAGEIGAAMPRTGLDGLPDPYWQSLAGMLVTPWVARRRGAL